MKGRILVSLFALPFFGVGVWMLFTISSAFVDVTRMSGWDQVDARILTAGYSTNRGDDSDTYEAYADYVYEVGGRSYTGNRVSLFNGADNIGDYQQDLGRNLEAARARGDSILVWVNPDNPSESIIDRGIRWGMVGFRSIFVFVFGGVGLGLLIAAWRAPKEKDTTLAMYQEKPWLLNDDWQTPSIRSNSKGAMYFTWGFAAIWNLISAPLPFLVYREITKSGNWAALFGILFTIAGAGLLVWAVRRTLEWRRFGPAPVTLDPFPGSIGGHVGGTIDINMPFDPAAKFQLTLASIHSRVSGRGKNRSRQEKAKWQDQIIAHAQPGSKGTRLTFRFDIPEGLHPSDAERDDSYNTWRLSLNADLPGTNLSRDYEVPVYATAEQSRHLSSLAIERSRTEQRAVDSQSVRNVVNLTQGGMGKRMFFPMGRFLGASIGGVIVGAIFTAAGWYLIAKEGLLIFGSIFGGFGALIAIWCLYVIFNSLEVRQEGSRIVTIRRWLGIPVGRKSALAGDIVKLQKKSYLRTQSGGRHIIYYNIVATDRDGNKMILGEGFEGESQAKAAIELIESEFGIRIVKKPEPPRDDSGYLGADVFAADS